MNRAELHVGALVLFLTLLFSGGLGGKDLRLDLLGGGAYHPAHGKAEAYQPGVNDFPLSRSHTSWLGGLSLWRAGGEGLRPGVISLFHHGGLVPLEDPSDGDRVRIRARSHLTLHAALGWEALRLDHLHLRILGGVGGTLTLGGGGQQELRTERDEILLVGGGGTQVGPSFLAGMDALWKLGSRWGVVTAVHLAYHQPLSNHWVVSGLLGFGFLL